MCQLIASNLNKKDLNLTAIHLLSHKGASSIHNDGFGFMYQGKFNKTKLAANIINNMGDWMQNIVNSNYPVFAHIRQASAGIPVTDENAHPFESKDFLLMHNGTLTKAGEKRPYAYNSRVWNSQKKDYEYAGPELVSDSKQFLEVLQKEYEKDSNFVNAFNKAMGGFWGKFAFLIYVKKEKTYYAIRGKSATLFISYLKDRSGFILNTERSNLVEISLMLDNINQIIRKERLVLLEPEFFELNTIWKLDGNAFVKVGDCNENDEKDFVKEVPKKKEQTSLVPFSKVEEKRTVENQIKDDEPDVIVADFMIEHKLNPKDIALLFKTYIGKDITTALYGDMEFFIESVIPNLVPDVNVINFLKKNIKGNFPIALYDKPYGLEFPWMINNEQDIVKAVKRYNNSIRVSQEGFGH